MTKSQRAAQIWAVLALAAKNRQTLTYDNVGELIGVPRHGLGHLLEPIQSYCIINRLPALSSLVVSSESGAPSEGFIAAGDVPREQQRVFNSDWKAPTAEELEAAVNQLQSNGKSLADLRSQLAE